MYVSSIECLSFRWIALFAGRKIIGFRSFDSSNFNNPCRSCDDKSDEILLSRISDFATPEFHPTENMRFPYVIFNFTDNF